MPMTDTGRIYLTLLKTKADSCDWDVRDYAHAAPDVREKAAEEIRRNERERDGLKALAQAFEDVCAEPRKKLGAFLVAAEVLGQVDLPRAFNTVAVIDGMIRADLTRAQRKQLSAFEAGQAAAIAGNGDQWLNDEGGSQAFFDSCFLLAVNRKVGSALREPFVAAMERAVAGNHRPGYDARRGDALDALEFRIVLDRLSMNPFNYIFNRTDIDLHRRMLPVFRPLNGIRIGQDLV